MLHALKETHIHKETSCSTKEKKWK